MPSQIVNRAPQRSSDVHSMESISSSTRVAADLLHGPDPSIHMLGLPKTYPHLKRWVLLAIITGAIAAFLLVELASR